MYGEEEEEMMASSKDPVIQTIWKEKNVVPYAPVPDIFGVYKGEKVFVDWKSAFDPLIYSRYSTPNGESLIHVASRPLFLPNYPGIFTKCGYYRTFLSLRFYVKSK